VLISVEDTGEGMDDNVRRRLFDPFFSTKQIGRGLGMAAVYGTIKSHGGWIGVESTPGEGTTVQLYLPTTAFRSGIGIQR
jgi:signal transduction histidine kinase